MGDAVEESLRYGDDERAPLLTQMPDTSDLDDNDDEYDNGNDDDDCECESFEMATIIFRDEKVEKLRF